MSQNVTMDGLSRLLRMARLDASLDRHCALTTSTLMEVDGRGEREAAFHVLLEGECQMQVDGAWLVLRAGDVVLIPRGERHRIRTPGNGPLRATVDSRYAGITLTESASAGGTAAIDLYCGHFRYGPGVGAVLFGSLPSPIVVSLAARSDTQDALALLSGLLRSETVRSGRGGAAILSSLCTVLLALVLRHAGAGLHSDPLWISPADPSIARVVEAILDDPGREWSIEALASAARASRATFLRRFSRSTGTTPGRLVARVRMMAATELLAEGDLTVAAVASQVGYGSESSFSRGFALELGMSPGAYRRRVRGRSGPGRD